MGTAAHQERDPGFVLGSAVTEKPCAAGSRVAAVLVRNANLCFEDDAAPNTLTYFNEEAALASRAAPVCAMPEDEPHRLAFDDAASWMAFLRDRRGLPAAALA